MAITLLKEGSYPDTQDLAKRTPLFYALQGNKLDLVRVLYVFYEVSPILLGRPMEFQRL